MAPWRLAPWRSRRAPDPEPVRAPETFAGLLGKAISNWDDAIRFIVIFCSLLFVTVFAVTLGIGVLVIAVEGIKGFTLRRFLVGGLFTGGSFVAFITSIIAGFVRRRRVRAASDSKPSSTYSPGQNPSPGQPPRTRAG